MEKYLASLHTYYLALSIAGSSKVQGAPEEEAFGSDSTKLVKVPWDVLQSYYFRVSRAVMTVPEASQLAWLEGRDIAERSTWVSQFREGDEPLGQVVQSVMEKRGAHWDTPIQNVVVRPKPAFQPQHQQQSPPSVRGQHQASTVHDPKSQTQGQQQRPFSPSSPIKMKAGTTADALRDGKPLCPDFNSGKCAHKGPLCDKGLHKCAKVLRAGRPCGMSYHGAHTCRNP